MSWQSILEAIPNPDRGKIGIEVELAIRNDVWKSFNQLAYSEDFTLGSDNTIEVHGASLEVYYQGCELRSRPEKLSQLLPKLSKILSWLKRRDVVRLSPESPISHKNYAIGRESGKLAKVPRGILPRTMTTGLHLHLDAEEWFSSAKHLRRFISLVDASATELKAQVIPQRYRTRAASTRGEQYALFGPPNQYPKAHPGETIGQWTHRVDDGERHQAVNLTKVINRGDVEVRIFHASLNTETIAHWVNLVLELVETTRRGSPRDWSSFTGNLDDPMKAEIKKRDDHYGPDRSSWNPDDVPRPSRRVKRIIGGPAKEEDPWFTD